MNVRSCRFRYGYTRCKSVLHLPGGAKACECLGVAAPRPPGAGTGWDHLPLHTGVGT